MPYGKGQPEEETVLNLGTGNHIVVNWFNSHFHFLPEGDLIISNEDCRIMFEGGELELIEALRKTKKKPQKKG